VWTGARAYEASVPTPAKNLPIWGLKSANFFFLVTELLLLEFEGLEILDEARLFFLLQYVKVHTSRYLRAQVSDPLFLIRTMAIDPQKSDPFRELHKSSCALPIDDESNYNYPDKALGQQLGNSDSPVTNNHGF
jgi:hypothetical protein